MFTGSTVPLADFDGQFGLEVVRDCRLSYVGKIPTDLDGRLVPCSEPRHIKEAIARGGIVGIVTRGEHRDLVPEHLGCAVSADPQASAWQLHEHLAQLPGFQWEDFSSRIDPSAEIYPGAHVAEWNVVIGPASVVMPGAFVGERSVVGGHCLIGPGAVLGCRGFDVNARSEPRLLLKQAGGVLLEDYVEIIGLASIARATFGGFTRLGRETKVDCHVYIAHDCNVGERVQIAAAAELSGRVTVGDDVFIGPNCSISNGLKIGSGAAVTLGAVVVRNVPAGEQVTGHFAMRHNKWLNFEYQKARKM